MSERKPLTDEELAVLDADLDRGIPPSDTTARRLIADLRASRASRAGQLAAGRDPRRIVRDGRVRWAFLSKFVIPDWDDPSMPYLVRWRIVQTPWVALYLHRIILDDLGRPLHDHPWSFLSFVLKGWYREEYRATEDAEPVFQEWSRWSLHRMGLRSFHGITQVGEKTWTLVLAGPRRQVWGFLTDDGWQPWNEVVEARGV